MAHPGLQDLAFLPSGSGSGEQGLFARARSSTGIAVAESDDWRAKAALWAYCRELCGTAASDRAVAAILRTLEEGPAKLSEAELLLITRATAAQFAVAGINGSQGKLTAKFAQACAETPARLAARASDALSPAERRELREHLEDCLPCKAIRIKLDRAERGFATLWDGAPSSAPDFGPIEPPVILTPADFGIASAGVDPARAKAAVRAYCRELCGPIGSRRAVAESLAAAGIEAGSVVSEDELLATTRSVAASQASVGANAHSHRERSVAARNDDCADTPARLAAFANEELEPGPSRELQRHLEHCLLCQVIEIKMERAERAFLVMAAATAGIEPGFESPPEKNVGRRADRQASAAAAALAPVPVAPVPPAWKTARPAPLPAPAPEPGRSAEASPRQRNEPRPSPYGSIVAKPRRSGHKRRLVAATGLLIAAIAVAAVLVLGKHASPSPGSPARHVVAATPARSPAIAGASASRHQAKAAPVSHRSPAKAKPAHRVVKRHRPAAPKHVTPAVAARAPVARTVAPVVPRRVATPVVAARPTTSSRTKPSVPSVTPQGTNLPAQSAPTRGIGSSGG